MKRELVVIGSSNTDMVVKASSLPRPGETVLGGEFLMTAGGKGANQAVAAARLGEGVLFICKVGNDIFGKQSKEQFEKEGVDTTFVFTDESNPSGVALISVDSRGENCIVVASGANANLLPSDIDRAADRIKAAALVLIQLETPIETVEYVAELCRRANVPLVLNPAPAQKLSDALIAKLYLITPNETEAELLSGIRVENESDAVKAAERLCEMGARNVIITLGSKGALLYSEGKATLTSVERVDVKDSTAAGDTFNGALVVALSEGKSLEEAVQFGCRAASISVTRMGAQSSIPYRKELTTTTR